MKKDIHNFCSILPRSSLVINFIAVLIKTPFKVLIQKPCDSLYLQFLLGPKEPDFVAYKHHSRRISVLSVQIPVTVNFLRALHHGSWDLFPGSYQHSNSRWRLYCYSVSVTLEARQRLESIKTPFVDIICLTELENYLLLRSISLKIKRREEKKEEIKLEH